MRTAENMKYFVMGWGGCFGRDFLFCFLVFLYFLSVEGEELTELQFTYIFSIC